MSARGMLHGASLKDERRELFRLWPEFVLAPGVPSVCDKCKNNASCDEAFNSEGACPPNWTRLE